MPSEAGLAPVTAAPDWAARLFGPQLIPAGSATDAGGRVWSISGDRIAAQISEQFKANAGEYHARYAASAHFEALFRATIERLGLKVPDAPLILDMGSGSGVNSIVPCFSLFPGARQVATDLSGDLLAMLADYAAVSGLSERVLCVVMDAMSGYLMPERFDLVTGASILHHLVRPVVGLKAAARVLKPGGQAIFFEPFEGYGLMRLAYERILAEAALRGEALAPAVDKVLRDMTADIAARTNPDPSHPDFAKMDDKWLFSREYFQNAGRNAGFARVDFLSHNNHETLYRDVAAVQLRLGTGRDDLTLPPWAVDILDGFDRAIPQASKNQFMLEGSVVFTKAG